MKISSNINRSGFLAAFAVFILAAAAWQAIYLNVLRDLASNYRWLRSVAQADIFSERLLRESLDYYQATGASGLGGFMRAFDENVHIAAVRAIDGPGVVREAYPYISNFNLQFAIPNFLIDAFGASAGQAYTAAQFLSIVGMAFAVSVIFIAVRRDFGLPHAAAVQAVFCLSPLLAIRAAEAYWMIFLSFLPFAASLYIYPTCSTRLRFIGMLITISFLIFAKSLTGYEYLSSITMAAVTPVLLHELKSPWDAKCRKRIFYRSLAIFIACLMGFGAAASFHVIKMSIFFGNLESGIQGLIQPIVYSSLLASEIGIRAAPTDLLSIAKSLLFTFGLYNFHINVLFVVGAVWLAATGGIARSSARRISLALRTTLVFSGLSSVSWSILMINHATIHPHINWVQMYITFYVVGAITIVEAIQKGSVAAANRGPPCIQ